MTAALRFAAFVTLASAALAAAPPTPREDVADTVQGVGIADPYRWLENWDNPKVRAWSETQNNYARQYLDGLKSRDAVVAELERLIKTASPSYTGLSVKGDRVFAVYNDPAKQQPLIVTMNAQADPASRRAVLDPNLLDPTGRTAFDWFAVSRDGGRIAVSLSKNGSEAGTLHVYDVAGGKEIDKPIPDVQYATAGGSLAWNPDGSGFYYTRYPGPAAPAEERNFNVEVYFHKLGTDWRKDPLVLGKKDGLERISEIFLDNDGALRRILVSVQRGDGGEWAFYLLSSRVTDAPLKLADYSAGVVSAALGPDGAVYAISRKDAPNGKILRLKAPFAGGTLGDAPVLVPESEVAILADGLPFGGHDLDFAGGRLLVRDIVGGPIEVRIFDSSGAAQGKLPLPEIAANSEIVPLKNGHVLFDVSTYLIPRYYAEWNPDGGPVSETALKSTSPVSFADTEVVRVFAASKDGTQVPVNVVMKKGTRLDGSHPLLLYGYGGYGVSQTPGFLGAFRRLWLDGGGIYAVANIRGGAEYGERWHREGMLTKKQNVFDDFAACADYLVAKGYTAHDKLALMGGSNGGLLMGAEITQHPELARAVVSSVGIYDMIRVENDPNGAFNTTEFGTVKNKEQFEALYAYSPYHRIAAGAKYPEVLMLTGATDDRVKPWHSRKFAAALQAASASARLVLLRTSANSGHGIGSSQSERIAQNADILAFLFDQLAMRYPASP
jgi:prolyl oligopeptidase